MDSNDEELQLIEPDPSKKVDIKSGKKKKSKAAKPIEILLSESTISGIAKYILEKPCKAIMVLSGAGISTNCGIPDVRTPNTGLYYTLDASTAPYPHAMFEIRFFRKNPLSFYNLMHPYLTSKYKPTICHYFVTLLQRKNLLLKNYTMNTDDLEKLAGVNEDKLGQINGTNKREKANADWVKEEVAAGRVPKCKCGGIIKPDIFFYGEALPQSFCYNMAEDMKKCDLLIILGCSLSDEPVASMLLLVGKMCPRLVINGTPLSGSLSFDFSSNEPKDVFWQGDCEEGCLKLAELLGWSADLHAILQDSVNRNLLKRSSMKS